MMGLSLTGLSGEAWRHYRRGVQMVFQDTASSLNPRKRIRTILLEAVTARGLTGGLPAWRVWMLYLDKLDWTRNCWVVTLMNCPVGSGSGLGSRGRWRWSPALLVADEPVSSLDVSLQGQIINLLRELNERLGLTIVLISHDLAVVARVCDSIAVMYAGRVVESGSPDEVLTTPRHPYTQALLDAVPRGLERRDRKRTVLPVEQGDTPGGCHFRRRCLHAMPACATVDPALAVAGPGHEAACLLVTTVVRFLGVTKLTASIFGLAGTPWEQAGAPALRRLIHDGQKSC